LISSKYSEKSDVWSFAILMIEIVTRDLPYAEVKASHEVAANVAKGTLRPKFPDWIVPSLKQLLEKCVSLEVSDRPTFEEIATFAKDLKTFSVEDAASKQ